MGGVSGLARVLAWIAGGPPQQAVFDALTADELRTLRELIAAHRLPGRARTVLAGTAEGDWAAGEHDAAVRRCREQIAICARIGDIAASHDLPPPIVLKGPTLYAHSGVSAHLHRSSDIDLLCADPAALLEVLRSSGFEPLDLRSVGDSYATVLAGPHQRVELHGYFPVPGQGPPGGVSEHRLTWQSLAAHRSEGAIASVLGPEAALIIEAAHLYGDFQRYPIPRRPCTIRAEGLAVAVDLAAMADIVVLRELCDSTGAARVLQFVRALSVEILARDPVRELGPLPDPQFPVELWGGAGGGLPACLAWRPWELVARAEPDTAVLRELRADSVHLVPGHAQTIPVGSDARWAVCDSRPPDCALTVLATWRGIRLSTTLPRSLPGPLVDLWFDFGSHRYSLTNDPANNTFEFSDHSDGKLHRRGLAVHAGPALIEVDFPWHVVADQRRGGLLFGIRFRDAAGVVNQAVLPLVLDID